MNKMLKIPAGLAALSFLLFSCSGGRKDGRNVTQEFDLPAFNPNPSGEYLSPEESMEAIYLPEGYHLELVASEPMIREPVAVAWDGNGRMYVAEMLTYMQDADASGEQEPRSRISLLEDTDDDGKMDKSTVFIDSLLLPRMLQCFNDQLLVNETNTIDICSYRDTNGDGRADERKVVYRNEDYVLNDANMEHQRSGLDWNLDNWMYLTYDPVRFRYTNGVMQADTIVSGSGGQWGLTHDNYGRLFYSRAGGEVPAQGFQINPVYGTLDFPDQYDASFREVWPIIATPDVQGGPGRLRPNETLNHFTAPCGQSIFRGDRLPEDLAGDYLVCEPVGRLIRRADVVHKEGKTTLENVYRKQEFISSSDMNFRPVNTASGPDGCLYIVDMHRGIIQQGNWTRPGSFLRNKIDSIGLAANTGHGRIYRVVHDGFERGPQPRMLEKSAGELLAYLDHPNGWWRDNAQKQLIALGDRSVVPALKNIAAGKQASLPEKPGHLGRIHALWTLEGMDVIDRNVLLTALHDKHEQVRRTAVWIGERFVKANDREFIKQLAALKDDPGFDVRVQLLLSLYGSKDPDAEAAVGYIMQQNQDNEMLAATQAALDKNRDVRSFGAKLGNLPEPDRKLILEGAAVFRSLCASCHGFDGKGLAAGGQGNMAAPVLDGSERLNFTEKEKTVRILLHGLSGPVDGKDYPGMMPPMGANSDEWIASVVSYIRYEFGGRPPREPGYIPGYALPASDSSSGFVKRKVPSPVVWPEEVKAIRKAYAARNKPWTLAELEKEN